MHERRRCVELQRQIPAIGWDCLEMPAVERPITLRSDAGGCRPIGGLGDFPIVASSGHHDAVVGAVCSHKIAYREDGQGWRSRSGTNADAATAAAPPFAPSSEGGRKVIDQKLLPRLGLGHRIGMIVSRGYLYHPQNRSVWQLAIHRVARNEKQQRGDRANQRGENDHRSENYDGAFSFQQIEDNSGSSKHTITENRDKGASHFLARSHLPKSGLRPRNN